MSHWDNCFYLNVGNEQMVVDDVVCKEIKDCRKGERRKGKERRSGAGAQTGRRKQMERRR